MRCFLITLFFIFCTALAKAQRDSISSPAYGFYTSFDSIKIYYETAGNGSPVLLIHGFTGSSASWRSTALLPKLLTNGFQVITVDLRGNGKSDKPRSDTGYASDAEAKDLIGLMKFLNIKNYDAIGYSRGSIITTRLLVLDKNIHRAVLGGMGDGFTDANWSRRVLFYKALSGQRVKELEGFMAYAREKRFDTVALAWQQKYQPSASPSQLKKVAKPVLVICGDADRDNGSPQALAAMFRQGKMVTVSGTHNTTSSSDEFANAILLFLKQKE